MGTTRRLKIYFLRVMTVFLVILYFREWNWILITSGDFGVGPKIFGLALAILCNAGLWLTTISMRKILKVFVAPLLLPTFFMTPVLVFWYHVLLSIAAIVIAFIAAYNLFDSRSTA